MIVILNTKLTTWKKNYTTKVLWNFDGLLDELK